MNESQYNPFMRMAADNLEGALGGADIDLPETVLKAIETAMQLSEDISKADQTYSRAAVVSARLQAIANHLMDEIAEEHGITANNAPAGEYALRTLAAATPEQLAAFFQALNQGYDLALYAFLEAYKLIQMVFTNPAITVDIAGMGTLTPVYNAKAKRKVKLMTQLQSPREAKRAELLAVGLAEIQMQRTEETSPAQILAATRALFDHIAETVKDLPNRYPEEDGTEEQSEDSAHG